MTYVVDAMDLRACFEVKNCVVGGVRCRLVWYDAPPVECMTADALGQKGGGGRATVPWYGEYCGDDPLARN